MSIRFTSSGSLDKTSRFLKSMARDTIYLSLARYGRMGVDALSTATPAESGVTATSWSYEIKKERNKYSISWINDNTSDGVPIVILLQYGHATGTGGYVAGIDFITPAMKHIFEQISKNVWKEVTTA